MGGDGMIKELTACVIAVAIAVGGCASVEESAVYSPEQMNRLESYKLVKILHAEEVRVDPESPGYVGAGAGAASGGLLGSQVGGSGAIAALAVLGGLAGYAIEQFATETTATRYVIDVDGRQKVIVQKESEDPLLPGDVAMMIGDYQPRLVKAPQEVIDAAPQNGIPNRVRVDEGTGGFLFDDELPSAQSQDEDETRPMSQQNHKDGTWIEPKAPGQIEPNSQQEWPDLRAQ